MHFLPLLASFGVDLPGLCWQPAMVPGVCCSSLSHPPENFYWPKVRAPWIGCMDMDITVSIILPRVLFLESDFHAFPSIWSFSILFIPFPCCRGMPLLLVSGHSQPPVASCLSLPAITHLSQVSDVQVRPSHFL